LNDLKNAINNIKEQADGTDTRTGREFARIIDRFEKFAAENRSQPASASQGASGQKQTTNGSAGSSGDTAAIRGAHGDGGGGRNGQPLGTSAQIGSDGRPCHCEHVDAIDAKVKAMKTEIIDINNHISDIRGHQTVLQDQTKADAIRLTQMSDQIDDVKQNFDKVKGDAAADALRLTRVTNMVDKHEEAHRNLAGDAWNGAAGATASEPLPDVPSPVLRQSQTVHGAPMGTPTKAEIPGRSFGPSFFQVNQPPQAAAYGNYWEIRLLRVA
jgi:hypothetical protein